MALFRWAMCLILLTISGVAPAASKTQTFMPENDLDVEDYLFNGEQSEGRSGGVTEAEFYAAIAKVQAAYAPLAVLQGAKLQFIPNWYDSTVNAYAEQIGNLWTVRAFGGMARRPEMTADGFALVMCHEAGHHFGGFPFYTKEWAASEGQSDYFGAQVCGRKLWEREDNSKVVVDDVPRFKCDSAFFSTPERQLCYRIAMAGKSLAILLGALGGERPDWYTPDYNQVFETDPRHPRAQCRMDTYLAGAVCGAKYRDSVIPGKNNPNGQDSVYAKHDALAVSCDNRPRCWFAP